MCKNIKETKKYDQIRLSYKHILNTDTIVYKST